jgi:archaellum component FlaC
MSEGPAFQRQVDYARYRIQQRITLNDDELDRLAHQLQTFKSEISSANERVKHLDTELTVTRALKSRETASRDAILSRVESDHFRALQALQQEQASEIEAFQREFQESIASLTAHAKNDTFDRLNEVTAKIQKLTIEIDRVSRATVTAADTEAEEFDESALVFENLQAGIITRLQERILAINADRANDLAIAKAELSRYAEVLEEMEQQFTNQSARLCHRIDIADQRYASELSRLKESRRHKLHILRAKRREAKMKLTASIRSLHTVDRRHTESMTASGREIQLIRLNSTPDPQIAPLDASELAECEHLRADLSAATANKERKLAHLGELRDANEKFKREIAKLQFELRYRNRE